MPPTLLLADDSVTIQRVIELTFADEDVRVVAVSDGGQAIAVLDQSPPDVVLADAEMPGQNGYEVARYIKSTPHLAHIPVLLLRGAFEDIDKGRAEAVGCDGVLTKPFEPQEVITKVRELLARSRESQAAVAAVGVAAREPRQEASSEPAPTAPTEISVADQPPPAKPAEFDTYMDRLDAALADLPTPGRRGRPGSQRAPEGDAASQGVAVKAEEAPAALAPAPAFPPLGEAFDAFLAAEQSASDLPDAPTWPVGPIAGFAPPAPSEAPPVAVPSDIVEQVTRRVLAQMSDRVVRETVSGMVSGITERLVKEEIARLKDAVPKRGGGGKE